MKTLRSHVPGALAALAVAAGLAAPAMAGDLPGGARFYVRGDLGGTFTTGGTNGNVLQIDAGTSDNLGDNLGHSVLLGGGFGVALPQWWLRADLTGAYMPDLRIDASNTNSIGRTLAAHTKATSALFLANLYLDIPTGLSVSPYVGGGVGFARNHLGTVHYESTGFGGTVPTANESEADHTDFAWSVAAGLGIPLTDDLTVDVGYRYLDVGSFRTSGHLTDPLGGSVDVAPLRAQMTAHEFNFALRYTFW